MTLTNHVEFPECLDEPEGYKDPAILKLLYVEKGLGVRVIAQSYDTTKGKVEYQLNKHSIVRDEHCAPKSGFAREVWDKAKNGEIGGTSP